MKVELLHVGSFTAAAGIWRQGEAMDGRVTLPVPAYLIETGSERILVDTGLHPQAVRDPGRHYGGAESMRHFGLEQEASVADQVELETLTKVVLTHLHFDHAGAVSLLPASVPIYLQRREWEGAQDPGTIARNFLLPADYGCLEGRATLLDGDHDLLGDGSVTLLLTPGHTPGHQSVQIGESLVIGADVAHFAATLDDLRFPLFADDFERQGESARRLRALRDDGATVMPGHDPDAIQPGELAIS
ncbi:MAG TPA: N-acyl homoserine lactonase family protein [Solirubrobacterales bacterium]|jgi:glyoxylase-like metal-dependent hydrolase (beta-lactamase superfamily II)